MSLGLSTCTIIGMLYCQMSLTSTTLAGNSYVYSGESTWTPPRLPHVFPCLSLRLRMVVRVLFSFASGFRRRQYFSFLMVAKIFLPRNPNQDQKDRSDDLHGHGLDW
ncbi:hypothetical protein K432DRAFT_212229 [Lepidopterella palustris CBS 459.81]|uniref:Secreted protein n=1 Tax=Lepidopterella palustris CBS 459.81 TaxID=1314670 RepID=A0A8E2EEV9_9PEZI|nr:hypothetical protein K432DRAFT_212229 [Lepidopterella palustris CBS 459.81]